MGETLVVYPHDICPVDGIVIDGHGVMNEAFLTGEPFEITKAPGSAVISGAVNGESALTIAARRRATDSRYAKIMEVMRESEQNQPHLRRLGDQLGRSTLRWRSLLPCWPGRLAVKLFVSWLCL